MLLTNAIIQWLGYVATRCSHNTCVNYKRYLHLFADSLPVDIRLDDVTIEHIERFIESLNLANSTKNNAIIAIKSFFHFCEDFRGLDNPAAKLKMLKTAPPHQRFLSMDEYRSILAACVPRERAIIELLAHSGLRSSEMLAIDRSCVKGNMLDVVGKGSKFRRIPLNSVAQNALELLLDGNMNLSKSLKLTREGVYMLCCRVSKRVGIPRFGPHALRRLFANRMRQQVDIFVLSKLLGHASLRTTEIYLRADTEELRGATDCLL